MVEQTVDPSDQECCSWPQFYLSNEAAKGDGLPPEGPYKEPTPGVSRSLMWYTLQFANRRGDHQYHIVTKNATYREQVTKTGMCGGEQL